MITKTMIKQFLIYELKVVAVTLPFILVFSGVNSYCQLGIPLIGHFAFGALAALPFAIPFARQIK